MANNKKETTKKNERIYSGQAEIDSDTFLLEPANCKRDISVDQKGYEGDFAYLAHQHTFHTFDSSGRPQEYCEPILGHFHIIEYEKGSDGVPQIKSVSPAMKWARKKINKHKSKRVAVPYDKHDTHTHDIKYIKSDRIKKREVNVEAVAVITSEANKTKPIAGISG